MKLIEEISVTSKVIEYRNSDVAIKKYNEMFETLAAKVNIKFNELISFEYYVHDKNKNVEIYTVVAKKNDNVIFFTLKVDNEKVTTLKNKPNNKIYHKVTSIKFINEEMYIYNMKNQSKYFTYIDRVAEETTEEEIAEAAAIAAEEAQLEEIAKEELVEKEFDFFELDNKMMELDAYTACNNISDFKDIIDSGTIAYILKSNTNDYYDINFDVIEEAAADESSGATIIKITDVCIS